MMRPRSAYPLAVASVGAAVIVLFIGASVIAAVGRNVPTQLWTSASALVGALVGILIPNPRGKGSTSAAAAASGVQSQAEQGATTAATEEIGRAQGARNAADAQLTQAQADEATAQTAVDNADAAAAPPAHAALTTAQAAVATAQGALDTAKGRVTAVGAAANQALATVQGKRNAVVQAAGGLSVADPQALADMGATAAVAAHQRLAADAGDVGDPDTRTPHQAQAVVYQAAANAALQAHDSASAAARGLGTDTKSGVWQDPKLVVPFIVFLLALGLGAWFSSGFGFTACSTMTTKGTTTTTTHALCDATTIMQTAKALIALAAAAGGVLIGVFATPPPSAANGKPTTA